MQRYWQIPIMSNAIRTHMGPVGRPFGELMPSLWSVAAQLTSTGTFLLLQRPPAPNGFDGNRVQNGIHGADRLDQQVDAWRILVQNVCSEPCSSMPSGNFREGKQLDGHDARMRILHPSFGFVNTPSPLGPCVPDFTPS